MNQLETYPQLMERSRSIGFEISKVVFRGYHSGERLQAMHDRAIESRTKVKLDVSEVSDDMLKALINRYFVMFYNSRSIFTKRFVYLKAILYVPVPDLYEILDLHICRLKALLRPSNVTLVCTCYKTYL